LGKSRKPLESKVNNVFFFKKRLFSSKMTCFLLKITFFEKCNFRLKNTFQNTFFKKHFSKNTFFKKAKCTSEKWGGVV